LGKSWFSQTPQEAMETLEVNSQGLTQQQAAERLVQYGPNELKKEKGRNPLKLLLGQFTNILMIILLLAIALSFAVGEWADALIILAIVIASAVLGFTQEYRSEKAVEALKKMTSPVATVIRSGVETKIPASQLVPGDIVLLYTGDKIPADGRLIEAYAMKSDEAPLTGESSSVDKSTEALPENTQLNDRDNMVYTGTVVVYGRGKAVVTSTGMNTEFGKIAEMVQSAPKEKTPLEKRMASVGKWIGILAVITALSVGVIGVVVEGRSIIKMILWAVSLAVAAVPEALPAIITGALAIGMYRMAKVNAVVKRLPAVETLGSTSVICSDKTGTMTKGEMTVQRIYANECVVKVTGIGYAPEGTFEHEGKRVDLNNFGLSTLLKVSVLCNDSGLSRDPENGKWLVKGDPTEGALVVVAQKAGIYKAELDRQEPRVMEVPFTSERKRMTTIHDVAGKKVAYMKGAPEIVLSKCGAILLDGKVIPLTQEIITKHHKVIEGHALEALRNLGFAYKELPANCGGFDEADETGFVFIGIMSMIDPPRSEVRDAIAICKNAGIRVVMITGDHKLTATAVAKELRLLSKEGQEQVLTGEELEKMTDEQLEAIVDKVAVYARVAPEHKTRIVKAWQKKGEVVAMTGDGVNDAPALRNSNIGIAMGISGTEVTKEAAAMVLADDNFATIVKAVREGREIYDNIKKYLTYLLQSNIMEILVLFLAMVIIPYIASLLTPNPDIELVHESAIALTAVQILWINLVSDGLPAIALGIDPGDPDLMERKPRRPTESIFSRDVKAYLIGVPIFLTALMLTAYLLNKPWIAGNLVEARTQLFMSIVLVELVLALCCRSLKYSVFKVGLFKNKFLWIAILSSFALQMVVLYVPGVQPLFDVTTPTAMDWAVAILFAGLTFVVIETAKWVTSRKKNMVA
jgi:P-type Ca2+ transporter type 2C